MARNDRTVRLEVVKRALAQSRRGVLLKQLAEKHDWNLRTLYRDIEALQAAHFPIVEEGGRYRLDGQVTTICGAPTPDERLALYLARDQAAGWKHTSLGRALDTLWNRISSIDGQSALFPVEAQPWNSADTVEGWHHHRRVDKEAGDLPAADSMPEQHDVLHARSVMLSAPRVGLIARVDLIEAQDGRVTPIDYKRGEAPDVPEGAWSPSGSRSARRGGSRRKTATAATAARSTSSPLASASPFPSRQSCAPAPWPRGHGPGARCNPALARPPQFDSGCNFLGQKIGGSFSNPCR